MIRAVGFIANDSQGTWWVYRGPEDRDPLGPFYSYHEAGAAWHQMAKDRAVEERRAQLKVIEGEK